MSIDWITVAAQIANFLVLVWLLKRFLYRPILDGIDAREAEIADRMQEAVRAKEQSQAVEAKYADQLGSLHVEQSEMTEIVLQKAQEQRDAMLVEARAQMEQERTNWQAYLDKEGRKYTSKLHHAGADALLSLTRKALTDLADDTLEGRMAQHLAKRIKPMASELRNAAGESKAAVVTSRDPLPSAAQKKLSASLTDVFPDASVRFDTDADQPPGLILRIGGAQLDWTVESYVDELREMMEQQLATGADLGGATQ